MEEIRVRSKVNRVVIYPDRALVTRRCFLELEPGNCEIVFDDMPATIIPGSLRAKGSIVGEERGAGLRLLSLEHRPAVPEGMSGGRPTGRRKKLVEARNRLEKSLENLKLRRSFFLGVTARSRDHISRTLVQKELSVEDCEKISDFLFKSLARADEELQKTQAKERELEAKIARLDEEGPEGGPPEGQRHEVRVGARIPAKLKGILELSYVILGARWSPFYEIHASIGKESVSLQAYGIVSQVAGETWPDVKVSLATTPPPIGANRPELEPLLLRPPADGEDGKESTDGGPARKGAPPAFVPEGAGWDFEVARPATVPSDGSPVRALLGQWDLKASYEYVCIPKFSEFAFVRARLRNTRRTDLLPGTVNIFSGGDFVGTVEIPYIPPSQEFEVYLGIDSGIRVRHQIEREGKGKGGVISKVQRKGIRVRVTVQNKKAADRQVVLMERMPVSKHKEIRVRDSKFSDEPRKKSRSGILTWTFSLGPRAKREITYSYTVEYPRGMRLQI